MSRGEEKREGEKERGEEERREKRGKEGFHRYIYKKKIENGRERIDVN